MPITEIEKINLAELMDNLRLNDIRSLIDRFNLTNVHKTSPKSEIITAICNSPTIASNDEIKNKLFSIANYFTSGGRNTLTLFSINAPFHEFSIPNFSSNFNEDNNSVSYAGTTFRFLGVKNTNFQGFNYPTIMFEYPGRSRQVSDFARGTLDYTPIGSADCVIRSWRDRTILDIRCPSALADIFANFISGLNWGFSQNRAPLKKPEKIQLSHDLTLRLRSKFGARSYQVRLTDDDKIDNNGKLHPSATEYVSKTHDLTAEQARLDLHDSAEHLAHGLAFDDNFEGIMFKEGCKIYLHFSTHQIYFTKISSFGSYNNVIEAIMEILNDNP